VDFDYTFSIGGDTGSGIIIANLLSPGVYGITGGTITLNAVGNGISGTGVILADPNGAGNQWTLAEPPNSGGADYIADNLFFPGASPQLDGDGFNFTLTSYPGTVSGNIWGNGPGNYTLLEGAYNVYADGGTFEAAAVPEPGSFFLLGTGIIGILGAARRKLA
jgi:hypothetical protein